MDTSFFEISAETSSLFLVLLDEVWSINTSYTQMNVFSLSHILSLSLTHLQIAACNYLQHPLVFDLLKKLLERSYNTMEDNTQVHTPFQTTPLYTVL